MSLYELAKRIVQQITHTRNYSDYITIVDAPVSIPDKSGFSLSSDLDRCYIPKKSIYSEIQKMPYDGTGTYNGVIRSG